MEKSKMTQKCGMHLVYYRKGRFLCSQQVCQEIMAAKFGLRYSRTMFANQRRKDAIFKLTLIFGKEECQGKICV